MMQRDQGHRWLQEEGLARGRLLLQRVVEASHATLPLRAQRGRNLYQLPEVTHIEGRRWI